MYSKPPFFKFVHDDCLLNDGFFSLPSSGRFYDINIIPFARMPRFPRLRKQRWEIRSVNLKIANPLFITRTIMPTVRLLIRYDAPKVRTA